MTQHQVLLDSVGKRLSIDDTVLIECIPEELLTGLPDEDQEAIRGCLGQHLTISEFDSYGNAEIEFLDLQGNPSLSVFLCVKVMR